MLPPHVFSPKQFQDVHAVSPRVFFNALPSIHLQVFWFASAFANDDNTTGSKISFLPQP
jgi:hypothetical protein